MNRRRAVVRAVRRGARNLVFGRAPGRPPAGRRPAPPVPRDPGDPGRVVDRVAVAAALGVIGLGVANLAAVDGPATALRQAGVALLGLVALGAGLRVRAVSLPAIAAVLYTGSVLLLLAVPTVGHSANGATRWIALGPLTFQPSELAKLGLVTALAAILGSARPVGRRVLTALAVTVPVLGLTVLQPDLSTTMLLGLTAVAVLAMSRVPRAVVGGLLSAGLVAAPLAIGLLRPYQVERLGSFLVGSAQSSSGPGWAVRQARIALGSASMVGQPGRTTTDLLARYLPERDTDLAPAGVVEQFGLLAGAGLLVCGVVLVWRLALAARGAATPAGALVAGGTAVLFGVEIVVSTGGNLGVLPLAGVPFPLLSYGGTALLVHLAALGLALGVRRDGARRPLWAASAGPLRRPRLVRSLAVGLSAALLGCAIVGWDLNVRQGVELSAAARSQMTRCLDLPAARGAIVDRSGSVLAGDAVGQWAVDVVPALVRGREPVVERVAAAVGRPAAGIRAALGSAAPGPISSRVGTTRQPASLAGIDGVVVRALPRRTYPDRELLAPVLGFTGVPTPVEMRRSPPPGPSENVGRAGLERQYDAVLRGTDGAQCFLVTPAGVPVATGPREEPVPGATLRTALDLPLQRRLAGSLDAALRARPHPDGAVAAAVAMDPRDGQVRALVSLPSYDANLHGPPVDRAGLRGVAEAPGSPMLDHAIASAVPPGSTFKLVTAAADVAHPVLAPDAVVPTGAGYTLAGHTFHNWRPMGPMNMVDALAWSNDVYFYKLAMMLGPRSLVDTARTLGVGSPTGIDLPGESPGYLGDPDRAGDGHWYAGSTVILGIGQGPVQVTPVQNARWTAAVATGRLVTPRIGLATGVPGSGWVPLTAPAPRPVGFAAALGPVREGMRAVVTGGTAAALGGVGVPVGGKTGTAQDGSLPGDSYDNWMTAVAPMDTPELVVTSLVQGPSGHGPVSPVGVVGDGLRQAFGP